MTTTPHLISPEEIMAYLDHELPPSQHALVAEHLAKCAECTAIADDLRSTSVALSSWNAPPIPMRIQERVLKLAKHAPTRREFKRRWQVWAIGLPVAAVLLVTIAIVPSVLAPRHKVASLNKPEYFIAPAEPVDKMMKAPPKQSEPSKYRQSRNMNFDEASMAAPTMAAVVPPPMIARTAALTVQVQSVIAARFTLEQILSRHHGYFAEMNISGADSNSPILTSSLRIPAEELPVAMNDLKGLGKVLAESQSGEEVGKQHADLVARLKTSRETEERYRAILQQRTGSVADVLEVEQAIAQTRGEIESMEAEQQSLEHRVNFASVQLILNEPYNPANDSPTDSIGLHNRTSIIAGWHNAIGTLLGVLYFLEEYGLTVLIWIAFPGLPAYFLYRRYRRKRSQL